MADAPLDLLVLGSGVAGLSAAVRAADTHRMRVGVLTKGELPQATTRWAQGGVAAVLGGNDPDSTDLHLADTLAAGAGLCDAEAVRGLVDEGPARVNELIAMGAMFDRDAHGELELAREGGHSLNRIVHAGGSATGAGVARALLEAVQATIAVLQGQIEKYEGKDYTDEDGNTKPSPIKNDMQVLHEFTNDLKTPDATQKFRYDDQGNIVFNFGKYIGQKVDKVIYEDRNYYHWILEKEFSAQVKKLTKKLLKEYEAKLKNPR